MGDYFTAVDENKNVWAAGNADLQNNDFRLLDVQYSRASDVRDREVREMEAVLMKQIEAAMTPDECEQLAISKEFDLRAVKRGK